MASSDLCTSPACVNIASEILSNLALNYTEIDPCTDFDKLACGNWVSRYEIPPGQRDLQTLTAMGLHLSNTLRQILEGSYPDGPNAGWITVDLTEDQLQPDKENFAKLQDTYNVCMNYTAHQEEDIKPLADFVRTIVDIFPSYLASNATKYMPQDYSAEMGEVLALFESIGVETFQRFSQGQNEFNPEETILSVNTPSNLGLPVTEEALAEWAELVTKIIYEVHPANLSKVKILKLLEKMVEFQVKLEKILATATEEESEAQSPNLSLAEVQQIAKNLNYEYVVSQLAHPGYSDKIVFQYPGYYKGVSKVISETPAEVIQIFFIWKAILTFTPYIDSETINAYKVFLTEQQGQDPQSPAPRWQKCVDFVNNGVTWIADDSTASDLVGPSGLTWIASRFFVDKTYPLEAKKLTQDILDNLKAAFLERLESRPWVTPETKEVAAEKVHAIADQIGLPTDPDAVDPIVLQEYYSEVQITSSYFSNALSLARATIRKKWASLGVPPSQGRFQMSTITTNAYYDPLQNKVTLLAGIQQFPMYDIDFPSYLLFGGMGSVVGHEITHGFDNNGRQFDKTGNKTTWWDDKSIKAFEEKTTCFIDQYNKFTITAPNGTQVHVNGEQTLGENIADAGGITSSYIAWQKWLEQHGSAKSLPGLEKFTHEQLFFLKWGQAWCHYTSPETALSLISSDVHSPNDARIKLALSNSAAFKKAFNCPNKEPTCELW